MFALLNIPVVGRSHPRQEGESYAIQRHLIDAAVGLGEREDAIVGSAHFEKQLLDQAQVFGVPQHDVALDTRQRHFVVVDHIGRREVRVGHNARLKVRHFELRMRQADLAHSTWTRAWAWFTTRTCANRTHLRVCRSESSNRPI